MLRHHKVKSSIIYNLQKGQNLHHTDYSCRIRACNDSQPQVSAAVKSLVFSILKTTHLRVSVAVGTSPDRSLPLPQVSVQHWEFGGESTGDGASGSCSVPFTPPLWPHSHTTRDEMYSGESADGPLHCPFLCVSTALIWEFVQVFLSEMVTMPNFNPISTTEYNSHFHALRHAIN